MPNREGFLNTNDPELYKIANRVNRSEFGTLELSRDIEKMLRIAYGEQSDRKKPVLVGLAGPQIGIHKRIILVDVGARGNGEVSDLRVFINPEITWKSVEEEDWYEACYSAGNVCGVVKRPVEVKVSAQDPDGNPLVHEYHGYVARIFQHEIKYNSDCV